MKFRSPAFTLIEIIIVVVIIAILSVSFSLMFLQLKLSARFSGAKTDVVNIIQKARSLSLSNILINGNEPTDYYQLTISGNTVTLIAYNDIDDETIDTLTLDSDFSFDTDLYVIYFPPKGDICFGPVADYASCDLTDVEQSTILTDATGAHSATFTININGGYVDVDD